MIDKKIYFYWGNQPMSFLRYMTLISFNIFNPEWKMILIKNNMSTHSGIKSSTIEEDDLRTYAGYDHRVILNKVPNLDIIDVGDISPFDHKKMIDENEKNSINNHGN